MKFIIVSEKKSVAASSGGLMQISELVRYWMEHLNLGYRTVDTYGGYVSRNGSYVHERSYEMTVHAPMSALSKLKLLARCIARLASQGSWEVLVADHAAQKSGTRRIRRLWTRLAITAFIIRLRNVHVQQPSRCLPYRTGVHREQVAVLHNEQGTDCLAEPVLTQMRRRLTDHLYILAEAVERRTSSPAEHLGSLVDRHLLENEHYGEYAKNTIARYEDLRTLVSQLAGRSRVVEDSASGRQI